MTEPTPIHRPGSLAAIAAELRMRIAARQIEIDALEAEIKASHERDARNAARIRR
jgi:hypothetical protein